MAQPEDGTPGSGKDERFRAEPHEMRPYAAKFEDLADDAAEAETYASTWVDFDPSGAAVFERFVDVTTGMDTGVRDLMADIEKAMRGTGHAIRASADRYARLDDAAARRLDRTYWQH